MKQLLFLSVLLFFSHDFLLGQKTKILKDEDVLKLYNGLRVADVSDGLDVVGLRDKGLVSPNIMPLWTDIDSFKHRLCGIAVTVRYVPTNKIIPNPISSADFSKWESDWYTSITSEPFVDSIKKGSVIVIDAGGNGDVGIVGSLNSLYWVSKGAVGVLSNGGIRDIDEICKEKIPVYSDPLNRGRGIRPGRNEVESANKPVTIGGVLIRPGDVIVADGDGVVIVPREYAQQVAEAARGILNSDKNSRFNLYKQLGIEPDNTVLP